MPYIWFTSFTYVNLHFLPKVPQSQQGYVSYTLGSSVRSTETAGYGPPAHGVRPQMSDPPSALQRQRLVGLRPLFPSRELFKNQKMDLVTGPAHSVHRPVSPMAPPVRVASFTDSPARGPLSLRLVNSTTHGSMTHTPMGSSTHDSMNRLSTVPLVYRLDEPIGQWINGSHPPTQLFCITVVRVY